MTSLKPDLEFWLSFFGFFFLFLFWLLEELLPWLEVEGCWSSDEVT